MYLARSFEKLEHAQYFLNGGIRIRSFAYYRKLEEEAIKHGRSDPNEGSYILQSGKGVKFTVASKGGEPIPIDIVRVTSADNLLNAWHIFSTFAGYPRPGDPKILTDTSLQNIRRFPERRLSSAFGNYTVLIHNIGPFQDRLIKYCKRSGYGFRDGLVTYVDPKIDNITPDRNNLLKPIFHKYNDFQWQQEYRVAIEPNHEQKGPLKFDIGDLTDFAFIVRTESISVNASVVCNELRVKIKTGEWLNDAKE